MTERTDYSELLYVFRVDVGEAFELCLIQVHEEKTVDRRQLRHFVCEFRVEIGNVIRRSLKDEILQLIDQKMIAIAKVLSLLLYTEALKRVVSTT